MADDLQKLATALLGGGGLRYGYDPTTAPAGMRPIYEALAPALNTQYGNILPVAKDASGLRLAMPSTLREGLSGIADLLSGTETGELTGRGAMSMTLGGLGTGMGLAPRGALPMGGGRGIMPAMGNPKTITSFSDLRNIASSGEPTFIRWSRGPEFDMRPNAKSYNQVSGDLEAGLSAKRLSGADDAELAKLMGEYVFLRAKDPEISPHIYQGRVTGIGGDGEPVISPTNYLGSPSKELLGAILDESNLRKLQLQSAINWKEGIVSRGSAGQPPGWFDGIVNELEQHKKELTSLGGPISWPGERAVLPNGLRPPGEREY